MKKLLFSLIVLANIASLQAAAPHGDAEEITRLDNELRGLRRLEGRYAEQVRQLQERQGAGEDVTAQLAAAQANLDQVQLDIPYKITELSNMADKHLSYQN